MKKQDDKYHKWFILSGRLMPARARRTVALFTADEITSSYTKDKIRSSEASPLLYLSYAYGSIANEAGCHFHFCSRSKIAVFQHVNIPTLFLFCQLIADLLSSQGGNTTSVVEICSVPSSFRLPLRHDCSTEKWNAC